MVTWELGIEFDDNLNTFRGIQENASMDCIFVDFKSMKSGKRITIYLPIAKAEYLVNMLNIRIENVRRTQKRREKLNEKRKEEGKSEQVFKDIPPPKRVRNELNDIRR